MSLKFQFRAHFLVVFVFVGLLSSSDSATTTDDWCYEGKCGPRYWKGKCKFGAIQSPINIVPAQTTKAKAGRKLTFSKGYYEANQFTVLNNGHTVQFQMNAEQTSTIMVQGAGFKGRYSFSQMHFHWGRNNRVGSEHFVKGKQFPLELHLVHEQMSGAGGIGVIGVIFGITPGDNPALQPIVDALPLVTSVTTEPVAMESGINLTAIFPTVWDVFRYEGSLTTPPCTEKILWTVFTQRVGISKTQMAAFRKIEDDTGRVLDRNYRPIKPLKTKSRNAIYWMPISKKKMVAQAFD